MLQYNTGYIILQSGDNPNTFPNLQGSQKQHIAINEGTGNVWFFNNDSTPKWTLTSLYAENVGSGIPVTKQSPEGVLQFKTLNSDIDTCEVIQAEGSDTISLRDYNHTFNNDKSSLTDMFERSYIIGGFDYQNIETTTTPIQIASIGTTGSEKYFTISGISSTSINLNPLKSGHKWIAYRLNKPLPLNIPIQSKHRPKWVINKQVGDRFYYETVTDPYETVGEREPFVNDYVEFLNPFINYTHLNENEEPLFPTIAPGETFNGIGITSNHPIGTMNRGNDIVLFMNIRTSYLVGMTQINKDFLVYSITEDLVTWTEPVEIVVTGLDIEGINTGGDTVFCIGTRRIVYLEEAGKASNRYMVLGNMQLVDGDGNVEGNYSSFFIMNENFEIEDNRLVAFGAFGSPLPPLFGSDLTKYNGNWRTIYYDSLLTRYKERVFLVEIDDLINDYTLSHYTLNTDYYETEIFLDSTSGKSITDEVIDSPITFRYLNYNNRLYLAASAELTGSFINSRYHHIGKAHPSIYIGSLVHSPNGTVDNFIWYWNRTNPFITGPYNYHVISNIGDYATKYLWQSGAIENLQPLVFENEVYIFVALSKAFAPPDEPYYLSTEPQTTILKLTDFTKKTLEDVAVDYVETSINYAQTFYDKVIVCNNSSTITITLRQSAYWVGRELIIKRRGSGNVIVSPSTGDTIDESSLSYTLYNSNESIVLKSVGNDIKKIN